MVKFVSLAEQRKFIICMFLVILLSAFLTAGCGSEDKYIKVVKQGTMDMEPNIPIGKAFDKFFSNGKWRSFKATDHSRVVEFTGKCTWNNKPATCNIQFIMASDTRFELGAVSINDVDMNRLQARQIVDKVLTGK